MPAEVSLCASTNNLQSPSVFARRAHGIDHFGFGVDDDIGHQNRGRLG
jgi:hypothetical protein